MSQIGSNIKKLRSVKSLSQQAFAELFNLTRGNISSYEELRAEPKIETAIQIAKYFSIPLSDFFEKRLTVNEILNFDGYSSETTTTKLSKYFADIPYVSRETIEAGIVQASSLENLPHLQFPGFSSGQFIVVENSPTIPRPLEFPYPENCLLFFEQVRITFLHTLHKQYGMYLSEGELFFGRYKVDGKKIGLILNDWKKESYKSDSEDFFWKLYAKFERTI